MSNLERDMWKIIHLPSSFFSVVQLQWRVKLQCDFISRRSFLRILFIGVRQGHIKEKSLNLIVDKTKIFPTTIYLIGNQNPQFGKRICPAQRKLKEKIWNIHKSKISYVRYSIRAWKLNNMTQSLENKLKSKKLTEYITKYIKRKYPLSNSKIHYWRIQIVIPFTTNP